jgi:hypothetical protein
VDYSGDEELGAIGIGTSIGHGKKSFLGMFQFEVFVSKFLAIDGFPTSATVCFSCDTWDDGYL